MKTEETKGRTMLSSSGRNVCISSAVITKNKNKKLLEKKNGCQKSFLFSLFLFGFLLSCLLPPTSGQYQVYRQDPFAMLSARATAVPKQATNCVLSTIQKMKLCLRTSFSVSENNSEANDTPF